MSVEVVSGGLPNLVSCSSLPESLFPLAAMAIDPANGLIGLGIALIALAAMEIVLGIDNIVFISIATGKLPQEQQKRARLMGLGMAMGFRILLLCFIATIVTWTQPLFRLDQFLLVPFRLGCPRRLVSTRFRSAISFCSVEGYFSSIKVSEKSINSRKAMMITSLRSPTHPVLRCSACSDRTFGHRLFIGFGHHGYRNG